MLGVVYYTWALQGRYSVPSVNGSCLDLRSPRRGPPGGYRPGVVDARTHTTESSTRRGENSRRRDPKLATDRTGNRRRTGCAASRRHTQKSATSTIAAVGRSSVRKSLPTTAGDVRVAGKTARSSSPSITSRGTECLEPDKPSLGGSHLTLWGVAPGISCTDGSEETSTPKGSASCVGTATQVPTSAEVSASISGRPES